MIVGSNLGLATSVNLGMEYAIESGLDWVLLVNNDATIDPECVARCLMDGERSERIGLFAPRSRTRIIPPGCGMRAVPTSIIWGSPGTAGVSWMHRVHPPVPIATMPRHVGSDFHEGVAEVGPFRGDFSCITRTLIGVSGLANVGGVSGTWVPVVLKSTSWPGPRGSMVVGTFPNEPPTFSSRNPLRHALESRGIRRVTRTLGTLTIWNAYNLTRIRPRDWATVGRSCLAGLCDGWRGNKWPSRAQLMTPIGDQARDTPTR